VAIRVYHRDKPDRMLPMISRDARLIVWPGVGAMTANMNNVRLEPGETNVPHIHPTSDDTIFILSGRGTVEDFDHGTTLEFHENQAIHVPAGVRHAVSADRGVAVVSTGGPCPADFDMLKAVGAWPKDG
jgi:quercetin dioxygenase-like cupin family protein